MLDERFSDSMHGYKPLLVFCDDKRFRGITKAAESVLQLFLFQTHVLSIELPGSYPWWCRAYVSSHARPWTSGLLFCSWRTCSPPESHESVQQKGTTQLLVSILHSMHSYRKLKLSYRHSASLNWIKLSDLDSNPKVNFSRNHPTYHWSQDGHPRSRTWASLSSRLPPLPQAHRKGVEDWWEVLSVMF